MVTICTASLTFNNSTFCPHTVFMCFVWISEQTAVISLYSINWLVCIKQKWSVYCAVRTEHVYRVQVNLVLSMDLTYELSKLYFHSTLTAGNWLSSLWNSNGPLKASFLRPDNDALGCLDLTFYGPHANHPPHQHTVALLSNDTCLYVRRSDVVFTSSYDARSRLVRRDANWAMWV